MYLSASAFDEAMKKEQARAKQLEDKYNEKIVEHSVSLYIIRQPRLAILPNLKS